MCCLYMCVAYVCVLGSSARVLLIPGHFLCCVFCVSVYVCCCSKSPASLLLIACLVVAVVFVPLVYSKTFLPARFEEGGATVSQLPPPLPPPHIDDFT